MNEGYMLVLIGQECCDYSAFGCGVGVKKFEASSLDEAVDTSWDIINELIFGEEYTNYNKPGWEYLREDERWTYYYKPEQALYEAILFGEGDAISFDVPGEIARVTNEKEAGMARLNEQAEKMEYERLRQIYEQKEQSNE